MTLKEHITALNQISVLAKKEDEALMKKFGLDPEMGLDLFDPKAFEYAFAERPQHNKAKEYLVTLDDEVLLKLETLMYFGREQGDGAFSQHLEYFRRRNDSKKDIVRTIAEKMGAYPLYFQRASHILANQGINIDTL